MEHPEYYHELNKLHWNPNIERKGLGTLLKKVNHVAIIVSDVGRSLAFYVQILGFQQIRRPNFDRYGAWLTMGNIELHLIKGTPLVFTGDNLIVGHISVETDNTEEVLKKLTELKVPFSRNVSVPDALESRPITQYFIRDPDGYYIEICDCGILTDFCLGTDKCGIAYSEIVEDVSLSHVFKLAFVAYKLKGKKEEGTLELPENKWANEVDKVKLANMLSRCRIYGDLMQGETEESISDALKKANNNVPRATKIIRAIKKGNQILLPPAFYEQGKTRYQPEYIPAPQADNRSSLLRSSSGSLSLSASRSGEVDSYMNTVRKTFRHFDKDGNGVLSKDEVASLLRALRQNPNSSSFTKIFEREDTNNDGVIDFDEFVELISNQPPPEEKEQWDAFFHLLDIDGNGKITAPEMVMVARDLGLGLSDIDVENIFIEADMNGDGFLNMEELKSLLVHSYEEAQ